MTSRKNKGRNDAKEGRRIREENVKKCRRRRSFKQWIKIEKETNIVREICK